MAFIHNIIPNTISAIRVGYIAKAKYIIIPSTKLSRCLLDSLVKCGAISYYTIDRVLKNTCIYVNIKLSYIDMRPAIYGITLLTKRSNKMYVRFNTLQRFASTRRGVLILTTSRGILSHSDAIDAHLGGELIA